MVVHMLGTCVLSFSLQRIQKHYIENEQVSSLFLRLCNVNICPPTGVDIISLCFDYLRIQVLGECNRLVKPSFPCMVLTHLLAHREKDLISFSCTCEKWVLCVGWSEFLSCILRSLGPSL